MGSFKNNFSGGPMNGSYPSQMTGYRLAPPTTPMYGQASMDGKSLGSFPIRSASGMAPQTNYTSGAGLSPTTISNSFFGGRMSAYPTMPADVGQFRGGVLANLGQHVGDLNVNPNVAQTQSLDQLGGANSAFFQNMLAQLLPTFTQNNALALAQAKESAGNLTGSGFANTLASGVNRSLADENQLAVQYANQALQQEMQRQQSQASLMAQILGGNADRYGGLISSFGNTGVGPAQYAQKPGASSLLPGLLQLGGSLLPGGSIIGKAVGGLGSLLGKVF